ncbi:MAG: orotidine-5'-phosphate decarboxylase [Rikenellaceae bacterium]
MTIEKLYQEILRKKSFLCVGLDGDNQKMPAPLVGNDDALFEFNRAIIDATAQYAVCYKPNLAFYEAMGEKGWNTFVRTVEYIKTHYPEILIIADAKRGDIGNTSAQYARAFFEEMDVDAVTLAPYMGADTVKPFLNYEGRFAVILALTSNPSAADFELQELADGSKVYEKVLNVSKEWGSIENTMYVVGATQAAELQNIRSIVPDHFLLVPGVGAQGGSLEEVYKYGANSKCGLLVNSSRGIIYASLGDDFAQRATQEARKLQLQMAELMK